MKLYIKNNTVHWALPDDHIVEDLQGMEVVKVPDNTKLAKPNEDGFSIPMTASEVMDGVQQMSYADKRAAEYPSIVDQLDTLYHGGYDAWKATIQAVKAKYPKEQP
jgi:hypothetical protein